MFELKDVYFKYDEDYILKNINIKIEKNRITGIIGKNGSGKSTIFLNMLGILKPSSGKIFFDDCELKYSKKALRNLRLKTSCVFQDPDKQIFYSRVFDEVAFTLRNIGTDENEVSRRVKKSLEMTDSLDLIDKPIHYLSYGQKKSINISSALAVDSECIIMDEPTAGLDPESTDEITEIIKNLKDEGKTIILSSHDMDFIMDICDYIYVIDSGEVVAEGTFEDVFSKEDIIKKSGLKVPYRFKFRELINEKK